MKTVKLKLSEDKARSLYPDAPPAFKELLEENFGKAFFRTDPMEWINDFSDVLEYHDLSETAFNIECSGLPDDEVAYRKIKLIAAAYNGGWTPDWNDSGEYKYYPWARLGGSASGFSLHAVDHGRGDSYVGSRLVFKERDHAEDAFRKFTAIYKNFFTA